MHKVTYFGNFKDGEKYIGSISIRNARVPEKDEVLELQYPYKGKLYGGYFKVYRIEHAVKPTKGIKKLFREFTDSYIVYLDEIKSETLPKELKEQSI